MEKTQPNSPDSDRLINRATTRINLLPILFAVPLLFVIGLIMPARAVENHSHTNGSVIRKIMTGWSETLSNSKESREECMNDIMHYFKDKGYIFENSDKKWLNRKNILIRFQSYHTPERKVRLRQSPAEGDEILSALHDQKEMMVLHMLQKKLGKEVFSRTMRVYSRKFSPHQVSWDSLQETFTQESKQDLKQFFYQWIDRDDIPVLDIIKPLVIYKHGMPTITFTISQQTEFEKEPFALDVTIRIITRNRIIDKKLSFAKNSDYFEIPLTEMPTRMILDPDYDLLRQLQAMEYPPVLSRFFGDDRKIIVTDPAHVDLYASLTDGFQTKQIKTFLLQTIKDTDLQESSLLLFKGGSAFQRLFGEQPAAEKNNRKRINENHFSLSVKQHPLNSEKVVVIVDGTRKQEVGTAANKLLQYQSFSELSFQWGNNIVTQTSESTRGLIYDLQHQVSGIIPSQSIPLEEIIRDIKNAPIIYIGESHTHYEDHRVQLEIIRTLFEAGHKIAIGMEMFQQSRQDTIDAYIAGEISEQDFLKKTQYYHHWGFDYQLYREVIQFAAKNQIPIIALNLDKKITEKVAGEGLDSLSDLEKKQLPAGMDMSDQAYRTRMETVFYQHQHTRIGNTDFLNFYQAQILWDETMAHAVHHFLQKNPDYQMIILAGKGHLEYGSGIPSRTERLTGRKYVTLINSRYIETMDGKIADYLLFPEPVTLPPSPRLGIQIKDGEDGVVIEGFSSNSVARNAGMEEGDIILWMDGVSIQTVDDIKIALLDYKPDKELLLTAKRSSLLFGDKAIEFTIQIP